MILLPQIGNRGIIPTGFEDISFRSEEGSCKWMRFQLRLCRTTISKQLGTTWKHRREINNNQENK